MVGPRSMTIRLVLPMAACSLLAACAHGPGRRFHTLPLPAGVADSVRAQRLAAGATLHTLVHTAAPWRAYVLDVDTRCVTARAVKGAPTAIGRTTTSALLAGLPPHMRPLAAINADFFLFSPPGVPTNLHVEGGRLVAGPVGKPVFLSDGARRYALDSVRVEGEVAGRERTLRLETWNRPVPGLTGIVDASWGVPFDSVMRRATIQRLEPVGGAPVRRTEAGGGAGATAPGRAGRYIVRPVGPADTLARADTLLLHLASGTTALAAGDTVTLSVAVAGRGDVAIREAVGGRPLLVVDSAVAGDVDTEGGAGFRGLNPRSAVGMDRRGTRLWYVVVDGRRPGYSMGMTLRQTAELMRALGATRALNLDGGGSSALAVRDLASGRVRVVNRPSDPVERPVGNAIAIQATCGR